ncbi:MAG: rhodanese-like domain-containing protein, partial [Candidatus Thiodiazotropha sp. 6PLUC3]
SYSDIEVSDLNTLLSDANPVIIDMRDHQSQSRGRLPSALSVSDETIGKLIQQRRNNPAVLVYCYHGNQSRDLCSFLTQMGLNNVHNLSGGWEAWERFQQS